MNELKVTPKDIKGQIKLPTNTVIDVDKNAVNNTGVYVSARKLIQGLKKAAKEESFPPAVTS